MTLHANRSSNTLFLVTLVTSLLVGAPTAHAAPISESFITRSLSPLVHEINRAAKEDPDIELYDFDRFEDFELMIYNTDPAKADKVIRLLTKLGKKYRNDSGYLFVSSWIVAQTLLPIEPLPEEVDAIIGFLEALPKNHGNLGRLQEVRIIDLIIDDLPEFADTLYAQLNTEELLVSNTGDGAGHNIVVYPQVEEYPVLGGDSLSPLFEEPSFELLSKIERLFPQSGDRLAWAEDTASISRYLHFRGKSPSRKNVEKAYAAIRAAREAWENKPFINDTVIYGATAGEEDRFLDEEQLDQLRDLAEDVHIFAADEDGRSAVEARADFLEHIEKTDEPITVIVSMHGNDEQVVFQNESGDDEAVLWADELAAAFAVRYERDPEVAQDDVLILESCSSGTYGVIFLEFLAWEEYPVPTVIAAGEAGQSTYSQTEGGSELADHYLFNGTQTLGDLKDNHAWGLRSNPTVLVPDLSDPHLPVQLY